MSFFDYALKRVEAATKTTVTCPICGHNSNHPTTKVRQNSPCSVLDVNHCLSFIDNILNC